MSWNSKTCWAKAIEAGHVIRTSENPIQEEQCKEWTRGLVLTPISFLDFTKVRAQGSGFLLAHWLWTVYLQPGDKQTFEWVWDKPINSDKKKKKNSAVANMIQMEKVWPARSFELFLKCMAAPCRWLWVLTGAAEALLPEAEQHALTHAAVRRLVKVLHPPNVLPIPLCHLRVRRRQNGFKGNKGKRQICLFNTADHTDGIWSEPQQQNRGCCKESEMLCEVLELCCHLQSKQNKQRHIVHASLHPLLQSDSPAVIHIDRCHHVFEHLQNYKKMLF